MQVVARVGICRNLVKKVRKNRNFSNTYVKLTHRPHGRGFDPRRRQIFFLIFLIFFNLKMSLKALKMHNGKDNDDIEVFTNLQVIQIIF